MGHAGCKDFVCRGEDSICFTGRVVKNAASGACLPLFPKPDKSEPNRLDAGAFETECNGVADGVLLFEAF